jgi:hypothetical protein
MVGRRNKEDKIRRKDALMNPKQGKRISSGEPKGQRNRSPSRGISHNGLGLKVGGVKTRTN